VRPLLPSLTEPIRAVPARAGRFLADLAGTVLAPGATLRRVARRRSLLESVAALLLLSAVLVALRAAEFEPDTPLFGHWLRVAAVTLAVWLFFAHLLWRVGCLLGGRTAWRRLAAATATGFTTGGALAALVAGPVLWWVAVPLLVWAWWIVVAAVRSGLRLGRPGAAATTLVVSALVWACYVAALPWRFERVGVDLLLGLWGVEAPAQHLLLPNLAILAALSVLAAGMVLAVTARRVWRVSAGLAVGVVGVGALVAAGWFVGYLNGFLRSPLDQPHAIAVADDGSLLIKGVGGGGRIAAGRAMTWRRRDVGDGLLPGPDGSALLLDAAESEALVVEADGRIARTLALPSDLPFGLALRLGEVAHDRQGRLYLFVGRPARIHRVTLDGDEPRDEVIPATDDGPAGAIENPLSVAVGSDGTVYVADRRPAGLVRVLRIAQDGASVGVVHEEFAAPGETWRLVAGLDGVIYLGSTRLADGRVTRWLVRRLTSEGAFVEAFAKTADQPGAIATGNVHFAVDADGTLYAADLANFRVAVFDPRGRLVSVLPADTWYRRLAVSLLRRTRASAARNP